MRILIVEDDSGIAELEKTYLEFYGYECVTVGDSDTALNLFQKETFDLYLIDIMLPGSMDGLGLCKRFRAFSDAPIIIVTAKSDDADKIAALGLGIDDYITKPFHSGELVARVKAHLNRYKALTGRSETKKAEIALRDIVIDCDNHKVSVGGKEVKFTDKEYQLLLFLMENPDKVFSKEQLFDRIWGMEAFGDISTVTVHMKKVRDKLGKNAAGEYIETVWGVGYRFCGH